MALINNLWVHVTDESWNNDVDSTSHPVEKGIEITASVRRNPTSLSISGKIVDVDKTKATTILSKLKELMKNGSLITYSGRQKASNMQIQSFETSHPNTVWGGCNFSMSLKEVRIAKSAYTPKASKAAKTTTSKAVSSGLKVGAKVVFKGGPVYKSSDAKKAAATRGRSTCKVTIINTKSWAVHQYHCISTDGKKVYGWVDKKNLEAATTSSKTKGTTKSGTQQTQKGSKTKVYHKVKKGDTVWKLVNKTYKELGKSCKWVIDNNPSAFSKKGDATTLIVGKKLLMGTK